MNIILPPYNMMDMFTKNKSEYIRRGAMRTNEKNTQIKVVPPPLIFFAVIIVGLTLHRFYPLTIKIQSLFIRVFFASMFIGFSGIIAVQSFTVMHRHKTDIIFKKPTTNLIITGPFKFSRNPLYMSLFLLYAGIGVLLNSLWFAPLLLLLFVFLRQVVLKEEKLLDRLFSQEFQNYKNKVRRWL
jgi:protein-S-isoprenylcysteine O-methyltransferase Ste14